MSLLGREPGDQSGLRLDMSGDGSVNDPETFVGVGPADTAPVFGQNLTASQAVGLVVVLGARWRRRAADGRRGRIRTSSQDPA